MKRFLSSSLSKMIGIGMPKLRAKERCNNRRKFIFYFNFSSQWAIVWKFYYDCAYFFANTLIDSIPLFCAYNRRTNNSLLFSEKKNQIQKNAHLVTFFSVFLLTFALETTENLLLNIFIYFLQFLLFEFFF